MKILKLNRKTINNQNVFDYHTEEPISVTKAELERFTPVLLKVAKKLAKK